MPIEASSQSNTNSDASAQDFPLHIWEPFKNTGFVKLLVLIGILINLFWVFKCVTGRHDQQDFAHYYASSKLYLDGNENLYQTDLHETYAELGWNEFKEPIFRPTNPPALIKLFVPFALLPPRLAHIAWMIVQLSALCLSLWLTYQVVRDRLTFEAYQLLIGVFLFLPFLRHHLIYSQVQLLLMAVLLVSYRLLQIRKGEIACVLVSVAALIKIYPIAILPWFVWRSGPTLARRFTAAAISAATLAVGFWLTDIVLWQQFAEYARPSISIWVKGSQCFTLCSAGERIGSLLTADLANEPYFQTGLGIGILFFAAFYGWIAFMRKKVSAHGLSIEFALLVLLTLFGGATCWWHYLVFLLFPMAVSAACLKPNLSMKNLTAASVVLVMLMQIPITARPGSWSAFLGLYLPLWAMLLMAGYLAVKMVTDRSSDQNLNGTH
ncbi:MAG: glycosyltransferase family 87 protein [Mariniblastus sp.]